MTGATRRYLPLPEAILGGHADLFPWRRHELADALKSLPDGSRRLPEAHESRLLSVEIYLRRGFASGEVQSCLFTEQGPRVVPREDARAVSCRIAELADHHGGTALRGYYSGQGPNDRELCSQLRAVHRLYEVESSFLSTRRDVGLDFEELCSYLEDPRAFTRAMAFPEDAPEHVKRALDRWVESRFRIARPPKRAGRPKGPRGDIQKLVVKVLRDASDPDMSPARLRTSLKRCGVRFEGPKVFLRRGSSEQSVQWASLRDSLARLRAYAREPAGDHD